MKALPIRMRLSLWYFALFATAACLLSTASWWMLRRSLDITEYDDLKERAEDIQLLLMHEDPSRSLDSLRNDFAAIYSIKDDGKWLQVIDQDGNWLFRSKRMIAENPSLPMPDHLPVQGSLAEFHQGTRYVRILAYPITVRGRKYSVQTGIALNKSMALLTSFGADLLMLTPAVVLLAALGGYWMSRKALRPVAILAEQARRINDRNLDTRLPVPAADDELSALARTLNQMLERIDKAFASVRAFTGNASHELRTPISLLRTEIEVALLRPREGEEYRATLSHLHGETIRLTNLAENLLSLARADGGAEAQPLVPIELNGLFQRIDQTWKQAMQLALIDFRFEIQADSLFVLGDPASIARLLSILLENACKFTPPGGLVVLKATVAGEKVLLSIRDTGTGISATDIPRVFDRFYRGTQRDARISRGSGLGLALGKWIAERHGTQLDVESVPGNGSCFSFLLARTTTPVLSSTDLPSVSQPFITRVSA
ncbi:sensor histidine kinase [Terracidiphilus sp.]|jgi:signal transduction histidine kinase|uniref:sensor histidine kinase n=1 Tax=Terracidiphilus sp. TaxID=1964191 RepID=UPI003C199219